MFFEFFLFYDVHRTREMQENQALIAKGVNDLHFLEFGKDWRRLAKIGRVWRSLAFYCDGRICICPTNTPALIARRAATKSYSHPAGAQRFDRAKSTVRVWERSSQADGRKEKTHIYSKSCQNVKTNFDIKPVEVLTLIALVGRDPLVTSLSLYLAYSVSEWIIFLTAW
jgi:hypothetical protein